MMNQMSCFSESDDKNIVVKLEVLSDLNFAIMVEKAMVMTHLNIMMKI